MTAVRQLTLVQDPVPPPPFCAPVIKYAGAKNWLVPLLVPGIHNYLSKDPLSLFHETFFGSGAMGLSLGWPKSIYVDTSPDLINLYQCLVEDANKIADEIEKMDSKGRTEEGYYEIRRETWPGYRDGIGRFGWAARVIYLNKFGFNGLLRTNKKGQFNVPWGDRPNAVFPSRDHLLRVGRIVSTAEIHLGDFELVVKSTGLTTQVRRAYYFDPPYGGALKDVSRRGAVTRKGGGSGIFTGYSSVFTWKDQVRLSRLATDLAKMGYLVVASNAWTDEICDLYKDGFALFQVGVRHAIGARGERRGRRAELIAISEAHAGIFNPGAMPVKRVK